MHRGAEAAVRMLQDAHLVAFSPIVLGELRYGFLGGRLAELNEAALQDFLRRPRVRVLPIGEETSHRYALILDYLRKHGRPVPTNDMWLAASAMEFGMTLLTADRHFQWMPQISVATLPLDG